MTRRFLFLAVIILAVIGTTSDAHARRGIPIPIVWGSGEKITEMGELPPEVSRAVTDELGTQVTVAFLQERVHLFWLDLWTWNGRHVLHSGDRYWELDSTAWRDLIGEAPSAKYGKPILYRIPLLPAVLVMVVVGYVVGNKFFKTDQERLEALMNDKRYQRSLESIFGETNDEESGIAITSLDEQRFLKAKDQLIGDGVDAHTAESNLRSIADAIIANTNSQIDGYLELASRLDQEGEWGNSAEVYSLVISTLSDADDRKDYARNCLALVNEKLAANAPEIE